ncbi:hypothetical protein DERP_003110 [Dermatophagoides pteronyssinus]|uniref:Uncharacterized protein n=1 Tax=Dermatophagoides pteronyssinus TaxID=6956 RepID=A0ABQ8JIJ6_DERPT|nr:hypothetical protein DERP_003110 [Dermatophagoides pteronyssinus]
MKSKVCFPIKQQIHQSIDQSIFACLINLNTPNKQTKKTGHVPTDKHPTGQVERENCLACSCFVC